ncbi:DnaB-like helicase C-terminal domain-containing protein [Novipirellula sp.]|uniref:DnaB-like helicase C-terminal domain-containing protein n=1 Tax=Novipirellula sp. TaxID=2795430 RepID=UPI0035649988
MTPEIAARIDSLLRGATDAGFSLHAHDWGIEVVGEGAFWVYSQPLFDEFRPEDVLERYHAMPKSSKDIFNGLMDRLRRGQGDVLYATGDWIEGMEVGPGKISIVAAPPGFGKTTFAMQYAFDAIDHNPDLTVYVANAEMSFEVLVKRELTRRSGVPQKALRFADLTPGQIAKVEAAAAEIEPYLPRIVVMPEPYTLSDLQKWADGRCGLLLLDYLQLFAPSDDPRLGVNMVMRELRHLANQGWGVLALSAVTRGKNKNGSAYDSSQLTMASLKESGEIEFSADSIYLLRDQGPLDPADEKVRRVDLHSGKNRHGERVSHDLVFDMPKSSFGRAESTQSTAERYSEFDEYEDNPFSGASDSYLEASF